MACFSEWINCTRSVFQDFLALWPRACYPMIQLSVRVYKQEREISELIWNHEMRFEWDPEKARRNLRKHGLSFDEAVTVFYAPLSATLDDLDHSVEERRLITIGYTLRGRLIVVSHTEKGETLRMISARPATILERKRHEG